MIKVPAATPSHGKEITILIGVISTGLSLIPTAWVSFRSNSIVLLADFLRCLAEFVAIFLSWLVVRRAAQGDRTFFDYGFSKLEQLASLAVSAALFVSFSIVAFSAVNRLINPVTLENTGAGLLLALLAIAGNSYLWQQNKRLAFSNSSPVIEAQWKLFRAKTFASFIVVLTLSIEAAFTDATIRQLADPCGSLFLAAFLLYSAIGLFSSSVGDLIDRSVAESVRLSMMKVLVQHESLYQGFQSLRARPAGGKTLVEVFLEFDPTLTLGDVSLHCKKLVAALAQGRPDFEITIIPLAGEPAHSRNETDSGA